MVVYRIKEECGVYRTVVINLRVEFRKSLNSSDFGCSISPCRVEAVGKTRTLK